MAWDTGWPVIDGVTDIQKWSVYSQPWKMLREKYISLPGVSSPYWPATSPIYASGIISTPTDNEDGTATFSDDDNDPIVGMDPDDGKYWDGAKRTGVCDEGTYYWVNVNCPGTPPTIEGTPYLDNDYDVIITYLPNPSDEEWYRTVEPWQCMRIRITANSNYTLTFSIKKLQNWIAAGYLPSLSALNNCRYDVIRSTSVFWHERWPEYPSDQEMWRGVTTVGKIYTNGDGYLQELTNQVQEDPYNNNELENNSWATNLWAAKDVVAYTDDDDLVRLQPSSNDANTIFFGDMTAIPTEEEEEQQELIVDYLFEGNFSIVASGNRCFPENEGAAIFWWYGGKQVPYYGHDPRDRTVDGKPPVYNRIVAASSDEWYELESEVEVSCGDEDSVVHRNDMLDNNDVFVSQTNMCDALSSAGSIRTRDAHKTWRGLQKDLLALTPYYVRPINYTSSNLTSLLGIPPYAIAGVFYDCSINSGSATLQSETIGADTQQYFTVSSSYWSENIYYQADEDGERLAAGQSPADVAGKVIIATNQPDWAGATIKYSAGFTRYFPEEFLYLYGIDGMFIPETTGDPAAAIDPPSLQDFEEQGCLGVGFWEKRSVSTGPVRFADYGYAVPNATTFTVGRYYRAVGNNWCDTTLGSASTPDPLVKYLDHGYEGRHQKATTANLRSDLGGIVVSGTKFSFTTDKNWWASWFGGGILRTQECVVESGTTTSATLDDRYGDSEQEESCWFDDGRFIGFGSAYEGFIYEVDKTETNPETEEPESITYKFPTTSTEHISGNRVRVNFAAQERKYGGGNVTIQAGDTTRIIEPKYVLNRMKMKRVLFTKDDNTSFEVEINYSDNNTGFIDSLAFEIEAGWAWQITEYETGGVWKYTETEPTTEQKATLAWQRIGDGKWMIQIPEGTADRGSQIRADMTANEPNKVKSCGLMRHNDYFGYWILDELFRFAEKLRHLGDPSQWTNMASDDDEDPEPNYSGTLPDPPSDASADGTFAQLQANMMQWVEDWWNCLPNPSWGGGPPCPVPTVDAGQIPHSDTFLFVQGTGSVATADAAWMYQRVVGLSPYIAHTVDYYAYGTITAADLEPTAGGPNENDPAYPLMDHCSAYPPYEASDCDTFFSGAGTDPAGLAGMPTYGEAHVIELSTTVDVDVGWRIWTKWNSTSTPTKDTNVYSTEYLGDLAMPAWPAELPDQWSCANFTIPIEFRPNVCIQPNAIGGWCASRKHAVIRMDVTDGYKYLDETGYL